MTVSQLCNLCYTNERRNSIWQHNMGIDGQHQGQPVPNVHCRVHGHVLSMVWQWINSIL